MGQGHGESAVTKPHWDDEQDEFDDYLEESLNNPSFRAAFEDAEERSKVLDALVRLRKTMKVTQSEVAKRMSTTQSSVSDLENGKTDPLLSTLQRYARAVTGRVRVRIEMPFDCPWMPSSVGVYEQSSATNVRVGHSLHRPMTESAARDWTITTNQRASQGASRQVLADKA